MRSILGPKVKQESPSSYENKLVEGLGRASRQNALLWNNIGTKWTLSYIHLKLIKCRLKREIQRQNQRRVYWRRISAKRRCKHSKTRQRTGNSGQTGLIRTRSVAMHLVVVVVRSINSHAIMPIQKFWHHPRTYENCRRTIRPKGLFRFWYLQQIFDINKFKRFHRQYTRSCRWQTAWASLEPGNCTCRCARYGYGIL